MKNFTKTSSLAALLGVWLSTPGFAASHEMSVQNAMSNCAKMCASMQGGDGMSRCASMMKSSENGNQQSAPTKEVYRPSAFERKA